MKTNEWELREVSYMVSSNLHYLATFGSPNISYTAYAKTIRNCRVASTGSASSKTRSRPQTFWFEMKIVSPGLSSEITHFCILYMKLGTEILFKIPYFNVIVHSQVTNRMSIFPTRLAKFCQCGCKIVIIFVEYLTQQRTIFESCIHSLAEKWDHCVTGVAH